MKITTTSTSMIADLVSPLGVYLRLRDLYPKSILLEGTDFHGANDCRSFVCCDPLAELRVEDGMVHVSIGGETLPARPIKKIIGFQEEISSFLNAFEHSSTKLPTGAVNGIFGYASFEAIEYMEDIAFTRPRDKDVAIPEVRFLAYRYILAFDPLKNEVHVIENAIKGEDTAERRNNLLRAAFHGAMQVHPFTATGEETSIFTDEEHIDLINRCKYHIRRGDVFQIVPSRRFMRTFEGDDFQVYRALRSINRSPYLFYADFGGYKLFGSSPEAQLLVNGLTACIHPIAGTVRRTGNEESDRVSIENLLADPKENAEHCMLVDLARNDLSRCCKNVHVSKYRFTQQFSHVIHLVSNVTGTLPRLGLAPKITSDTFPAGTLSGAPKHRAMQILAEHEPIRREHYGGAVGFFGFNGDAVLAIMIRSFLSKNKTLVYQTGGGVVYDSKPENEVQEVNAKVGALRAAIIRAQELTEGI